MIEYMIKNKSKRRMQFQAEMGKRTMFGEREEQDLIDSLLETLSRFDLVPIRKACRLKVEGEFQKHLRSVNETVIDDCKSIGDAKIVCNSPCQKLSKLPEIKGRKKKK